MGEHTIREILRRRSPETQRAMKRRRELAGGNDRIGLVPKLIALVVVLAILGYAGYLGWVARQAGQRFAAEQAASKHELTLSGTSEFLPNTLLAAFDPAFYTQTGVGTLVAEGKETKVFDGEEYVMERGLVGDIALIKAWKGDTAGNLIYRKTARNFNPMMATAAKVTVAEVENLVQPGDLNADHIVTPGVYVKRIVHVPDAVKHIEQRTVRKRVMAAAGTGEEV